MRFDISINVNNTWRLGKLDLQGGFKCVVDYRSALCIAFQDQAGCFGEYSGNFYSSRLPCSQNRS